MIFLLLHRLSAQAIRNYAEQPNFSRPITDKIIAIMDLYLEYAIHLLHILNFL